MKICRSSAEIIIISRLREIYILSMLILETLLLRTDVRK